METNTNIPKPAPRPADAHKGAFGRVLIVGGSLGMSGAPAIAGRAALRSGAGLVRVAAPQSILDVVAAIEPCYTTIPLADDDAGRISNRAVATVLESAAQNDVVAYGPGVGIARGVKNVLAALLAVENLRLIIDADGLNCLAKIGNWPGATKASVIITPHPGEMKRLWKGLFREPPPDDRTVQATTLAQGTGCVVVLKGAGTVVTDGAKVYINQSGNPGICLLYTSPSPRDLSTSRMPSSA